MSCKVFFIMPLLRCNSRPIDLTISKCTIQWFLVCSQNCATVSTINFRRFLSPQKEAWHSLVTSHFPSVSSARGSQHPVSVHGFASSGHFVYMDSYNMWSFVTGFFRLAWLIQIVACVGSTSFLFIVKLYSTVWPYHILLTHS